MDTDLLKTSIEDVAFALWNGIMPTLIFAERFLEKYPGFAEIWEKDKLARALIKRV